MSKSKLFLLGVITLTVFPLVAFLVHLMCSEESFITIFNSDYSLIFEMVLGSVLGLVIAILGWLILNHQYIAKETNRYIEIFNETSLTPFLIIFVSLSAGVGEEIFFRGVLQRYLGVIITSFFFVGIHGYLNPKNLKITIYGLYMVLVICIVGYCSQEVGLISAIVAHSVIDIVLLTLIKVRLRKGNTFL